MEVLVASSVLRRKTDLIRYPVATSLAAWRKLLVATRGTPMEPTAREIGTLELVIENCTVEVEN
jgi:hypothetical protein